MPVSRLALLIAAAFAAPAWGQSSFTDLGTLGGVASLAAGVSADGSVVVGQSYITGDAAWHAFRWTSGGMVDLGTLGGTHSYANGVSADGSVVVGRSNITGNTAFHAFRWTSGGMTDLGTLGGTYSAAHGVSADGSVVVGESDTTGNAASHAFRWTSGGMTDLGTLGGMHSYAYGISADGSVVVGDSRIAGDAARHAFRWTSGGMMDLGTLGGMNSYASGVSADGSVVVGDSAITGDAASHAFRWTSGGMSDLGTLGGTHSYAHGISADGSVVVGDSNITGNTANHAFRWTQAGGMQDVADWLAGAGVSAPAGWTLVSATGVSSDGSVLVGDADTGTTTRAWLARVGGAGSGLITDIPAFNATLAEAGGRAARAGVDLPNLALFGAHHRSLLDSGLARKADGACAWATADAARYNATDTRMELAEAGACKDMGSARLGVGIGAARARQDWSLGGSAKYDGQYLVAEIANAFANGMEASFTGYYGRFDTELRRNYMNGAATDTSRGTPDARSTALRVRMDWKDLAKSGVLNLSPYAAYTWTQTKLDAYTETDGGFPAQFAAARWRTGDLRAGLAGATALSGHTALRLSGELVHSFEDSTGGVSGQVIGLWGFALPGESVKRTWARAIADIDHRLSDESLLTASLSAASTGQDASWTASLGWRMAF